MVTFSNSRYVDSIVRKYSLGEMYLYITEVLENQEFMVIFFNLEIRRLNLSKLFIGRVCTCIYRCEYIRMLDCDSKDATIKNIQIIFLERSIL
jgi:hypothetical protein